MSEIIIPNSGREIVDTLVVEDERDMARIEQIRYGKKNVVVLTSKGITNMNPETKRTLEHQLQIFCGVAVISDLAASFQNRFPDPYIALSGQLQTKNDIVAWLTGTVDPKRKTFKAAMQRYGQPLYYNVFKKEDIEECNFEDAIFG